VECGEVLGFETSTISVYTLAIGMQQTPWMMRGSGERCFPPAALPSTPPSPFRPGSVTSSLTPPRRGCS